MEHHGEALHQLKVDREFIAGLKRDYRKVDLSSKTRGILQYAERLTKKPQSVVDAHVEVLRQLGCSDREILDICQITAYFNYVNRIAHGLGVQLEQEE